ncbi:MAG: hypothetical protein AABW48_00495 [Nanoarchaeota archaeon]
MAESSSEHRAFLYLQHWKKEDDLESLLYKIRCPAHLFSYAYQKTKSLYLQLPPRLDGNDPLTHPLNAVLALEEAKVADETVLCAGLLHDYVEESVDLYKRENKLSKDEKSIGILDNYELTLFDQLQADLTPIGQDVQAINKTIGVLKLLTRHKREFYYRSVSNIFLCTDEKLKEMAIQVKLADRMHNILSLESFTEEDRNFQCFKNLFIINNAKKFLLDDVEHRVAKDMNILPTELLFKRCSKATYDAFLTICHDSAKKGVEKVSSMLQLAFKKFALEKAGVWQVTNVNENETHLMRLFQGVVRKYDARLHHEWDKYEQLKENERNYCRKFFSDFNFTEEQIGAVLDYKDAYALKEMVADLLYVPDYVLHKFLSSELDPKARILE